MSRFTHSFCVRLTLDGAKDPVLMAFVPPDADIEEQIGILVMAGIRSYLFDPPDPTDPNRKPRGLSFTVTIVPPNPARDGRQSS